MYSGFAADGMPLPSDMYSVLRRCSRRVPIQIIQIKMSNDVLSLFVSEKNTNGHYGSY